jgi:hypothetical protein
MTTAIQDQGIDAAPLALPWTTPPSDLGSDNCRWCDRSIYLPAVPCSTRPVDGLLTMTTAPGLGDRCKYELSTRMPAESLR